MVTICCTWKTEVTVSRPPVVGLLRRILVCQGQDKMHWVYSNHLRFRISFKTFKYKLVRKHIQFQTYTIIIRSTLCVRFQPLYCLFVFACVYVQVDSSFICLEKNPTILTFLFLDDKLAKWGDQHGLNRETLSMLNMEGVLSLDHLRQLKAEDVALMRRRYDNVPTMQLRLLEDALVGFERQSQTRGTVYWNYINFQSCGVVNKSQRLLTHASVDEFIHF